MHKQMNLRPQAKGPAMMSLQHRHRLDFCNVRFNLKFNLFDSNCSMTRLASWTGNPPSRLLKKWL
jgi:hypothetical protein